LIKIKHFYFYTNALDFIWVVFVLPLLPKSRE